MITFMFRMTYIMLEMITFYDGNVCGLVTIWYFWVHFGDIIELFGDICGTFRVYFCYTFMFFSLSFSLFSPPFFSLLPYSSFIVESNAHNSSRKRRPMRPPTML